MARSHTEQSSGVPSEGEPRRRRLVDIHKRSIAETRVEACDRLYFTYRRYDVQKKSQTYSPPTALMYYCRNNLFCVFSVLMILTLIVLWLDSQSLERIIVACINFICHILGISDLHYYFPTSGSETIPKIREFRQRRRGRILSRLLVFTRFYSFLLIFTHFYVSSFSLSIVLRDIGRISRVRANFHVPVEKIAGHEHTRTHMDRHVYDTRAEQ